MPMTRLAGLAMCAAVALQLACSRGGDGELAKARLGAAQAAPLQAPGGGPNRAPNKWALLVGINRYKYADKISPLDGCVNDIEDMKAVLVGKFGFPPENILTLKDEQATHAAILSAIQNHLVAKAQPGDIVVFDFSGHGSQMKDATGKTISGLDETIVPHDSRDPEGKVFDISGAELHGPLQALAAKTKNITFVLDSCHSGTLLRGGNKVRAIAPDTRTPPAAPAYAGVRGLHPTVGGAKPGYAVIAAATSKESAFEHFSEGKEHGALTYFLARQLRAARAGATYRDVMDAVISNVNSNYPAQHPQLEGAEADQNVFGDASSVAQTYILASPVEGDKTKVSLAAGQVQGLTAGSLFDIFPPGAKQFNGAPVAKVRLTDVQPFTAEAKVASGNAVPAASRAVEREHQYGSRKLRVFFDDLQGSAALQAVVAALGAYRQVEIAADARTSNMQVRQDKNRILTLAPDGTTLSTPVAADNPQAAKRVADQIAKWAKWFNVLSIHNAQPVFGIDFTLRNKRDGSTRDPMVAMTKPDAAILAGEKIEAVIKNNSERALYISILDLSSDGTIAVVYPPDKGQSEVLQPGLSFSTEYETFVPEGRSLVNDVLKVFASAKPINLSPLEQQRIRGEVDPVGDLLEDAAGLERGVRPAQKLGEWVTAQRLVVIRRKR